MFNTFALTLRPDDFRAVLAWGFALLMVLASRAFRMLRHWPRTTHRALPTAGGVVPVYRTHVAVPRLGARWERDGEGVLRCRWRLATPTATGVVIMPRRIESQPRPLREVA